MSDHDHHHEQESRNPIASLVGLIFLVLVPLSLIVMLGFIGAAFIQGGGHREEAPAPKLAAVAPPKAATPAPNPNNAAAVSPAPAKTEPSGTAKPAAPADTGEGPSAEQMALGQSTYAMCAACHGPDGKGLQVGPQKMAPSFEGSELLLGNPEASLAAVFKGIEKVPGTAYLGQMMALGAGLDDAKIAAVLTYTRNSFGNKASPVTVEQAAEARAKYSDVAAPMGLKRADLEKVAKEK